jgi:DNA-binding response OmpR family regulator
MMPTIDGWTVCQRLKQVCESPVIFLTAKSDTQDVVRGLSIGADDYMVKPCKLEELKIRLRKLLSQSPDLNQSNPQSAYDDGSLRIEAENGRILRHDEIIDLTPTETRLLNYLVNQRGRVVPHGELMTHVWGPQFTEDVKYLSVYIRYLRQKVEIDPAHPQYILTKHRVGYYFAEPNACS